MTTNASFLFLERGMGVSARISPRVVRLWLAAITMYGTAIHGVCGATAVEAFDYPHGVIVGGQNGGAGWAGAWSPVVGNGTIIAENGSLAYPGLESTGGKMHFIGVSATGTTTTTYRTNAVPLTNGTFYASFLGQNLNGARRYFGLAFFDGNTERMLLGQGTSFTNWTLNHVGGITNEFYTNVLVSPVSSTRPSLLVLKVELLEGPERVTFWVNPDLSQPEEPATAVGGTNFLTDADFFKFTRVRIGGGGYSAAVGDPTEHYLDEIRISSVSPFLVEPPPLTYGRSGGRINLSWPSENRGWILQAQTNPGTASLTTNWTNTDVPGTELVSSTNLPIDPAQAAQYFRLRSP